MELALSPMDSLTGNLFHLGCEHPIPYRSTPAGLTMSDPLIALTLVAALGCGLNAGVFFSFSSFVMKALARLQPAQGLGAMQSINITAVTPPFMTALFGTAVACLAIGVWALLDWHDSFGPYLLAGSGTYLVGTIGLTVAYHVPRNDVLATLDPNVPDAARRWNRYLAEWTAWNHLRAVAALAAAAALTVAPIVS
jgi:uncharacterized membrane protein